LRETLKDVKKKIVLYKKLKTKKLLKSSIIPLNKMEKVCSKCGVSKSAEGFGRDNSKKSGVRSHCKECVCENTKKYNASHKEAVQKRKAEHRNKPEVKALEKKRYKEYYHRPDVKARYEEYRNAPDIKERYEEYRNKPEVIERKKQLEKENAPLRNEQLKERYKNDKNYQLTAIVRSRIQKALKRNKTNSSFEYLGCDVEFLKNWLEYRFDENMSWENMGSYWHIDHIIPVHSFDITNSLEQKICFHWTNLQPLSATENLTKKHTLHPHYYFNNIINVNRFNSKYKQFLGYQTLIESLRWLRIKLRYGKNSTYDSVKTDEIGNPQPSL